MKISNLTIGQVFRSFNELCRCLEVNAPRSGKEKENIVKKLKRYMEWQEIKKGRSNEITIIKIYEVPKEIEDGRGKSQGSRGNNNKYQTDMSKLIEHLLATDKIEVKDTTINNLALNSFIASEIFKDSNNDKDKCFEVLIETFNITNKTAYDDTRYKYFYMVKGGIFSALGLLQEQGKIEYEKRTFAVIDNKLEHISEQMNKTLEYIEEEVMQEVINKHSNNKNQLNRYKVMDNFKYRNLYFRNVLNKFNKLHGLNAEMLFKGITIRNIACNVHENITEISDKLNNTLMNLVLEKNKVKVIETKEVYNKKNEEKRNSFAFVQADYKSLMEAYEEDIILNEKSYIEDTIRLSKLFSGKVNKEKIETNYLKEEKQNIHLSDYLNDVRINESNVSLREAI